MDTASLKITYNAFQSNSCIEDFDKINIFKDNISKSYSSIVKPIIVGRGGDAYQLIIDFFVNLHSHEYFKFIEGYLGGKVLDKIADPLIDSYIFKPLKNAYNKLKETNPILDCYLFTIELLDTKIFIYSIYPNSIIENQMQILTALDKHFKNLIVNDEFPSEIHIPVYDQYIQQHLIYRPPLDKVEIINTATKNNYFKLWGLKYQYTHQSIVYDLENQMLLPDHQFMKESEYEIFFKT